MQREELLKICLKDEENKKDISLPLMTKFASSGPQNFVVEPEMEISDWGITTLCNKLRIPTLFFKRNPDKLREDLLNYWYDHKALNLRQREGAVIAKIREFPTKKVVRAFVSKVFYTVSNSHIVEQLGNIEVVNYKLSDSGMSLYLRAPVKIASDADNINIYIKIKNSDVLKMSFGINYSLSYDGALINIPKRFISRSLAEQHGLFKGLTISHIYAHQKTIDNAIKNIISEETHSNLGTLLSYVIDNIVRATLNSEQEIENLKKVFGQKLIEDISPLLGVRRVDLAKTIYDTSITEDPSDNEVLEDNLGKFVFNIW